MNRLAACYFTLISIPALAQEPTTKAPVDPPGWSTAIEGAGIPRDQNAKDYVAEVDHSIFRGGKAAVTIRSIVEKPAKFRSITQLIKADAYRGKRVRLVGYLKSREVTSDASLWFRVDGPTDALAFDNMEERPNRGTTDWTRFEAVLDVPVSAMRLAFGAFIGGPGQIWVDDFTLEEVDPARVKSTQLIQYGSHRIARTTNLGFEPVEGDADPVPGWVIHGHDAMAYTWRLAEGGAHGGRTCLEARSNGTGAPTVVHAAQNVDAEPFRGRRVRFQVYLKTEGDNEAYLAVETWSKSAWARASGLGRGAKGQTGWVAREIVIDVPADAEVVGLGVMMGGTGTVGIDDASVEIVDPAKVALTTESDLVKAAREKRAKELAETYPKLPERPENLDFERQAIDATHAQ